MGKPISDRFGTSTKIQSPPGKNYNVIAIPNNISRLLGVKQGDFMLWLPLPEKMGDEFSKIVIVTTDENQYNLPDEAKRILGLLQE